MKQRQLQIKKTAQKRTTPTHTSLISPLESVFAALFAYIFVAAPPVKGDLGAILILVGILTAQLNLKKPRKRKRFNQTVDGPEAKLNI
ncbi:DMT family transporter [Ureibacillus manganicus]|uniref:hypothetical protein n=1 Tax=Ureibacillus manganicus TaxID=1266064 RepID=UPI001B807293|nr:hypothetical protein [Ureibacillus manganicus]